jgi:hypothetical protein
VYNINAVDEVTLWEVVGVAVQTSEAGAHAGTGGDVVAAQW